MSSKKMSPQETLASVTSILARPVVRRDTPIFNQVMADAGLKGKNHGHLFALNDKDKLRLPHSWREAAAEDVEHDLAWCRAQWS